MTLHRNVKIMASVIVLVCFPAFSAQAQPICGTRHQVLKLISDGYGETQQKIKVINSREIFEMWASEETGSWTILKTNLDGFTCVAETGSYWTKPEIGNPA